MSIHLPPPLAAYFAADASGDTEGFLGCFAPDAIVTDERRTYRGLSEIRAWKTGAAAQYDYLAEPVAIVQEEGGRSVVTARLTGNFPGSPIDLRYRFALADGLIAALEIAA